jgi:S-formylglutathione hydrolase FrmB
MRHEVRIWPRTRRTAVNHVAVWRSFTCICFMHPRRFFVYFPPQAEKGKVPVLYYLSGLTCTDENFTQKVCHYCDD